MNNFLKDKRRLYVTPAIRLVEKDFPVFHENEDRLFDIIQPIYKNGFLINRIHRLNNNVLYNTYGKSHTTEDYFPGDVHNLLYIPCQYNGNYLSSDRLYIATRNDKPEILKNIKFTFEFNISTMEILIVCFYILEDKAFEIFSKVCYNSTKAESLFDFDTFFYFSLVDNSFDVFINEKGLKRILFNSDISNSNYKFFKSCYNLYFKFFSLNGLSLDEEESLTKIKDQWELYNEICS